MATPASTDPSDPTQQALISLVIRGMVRGAPDEASGGRVFVDFRDAHGVHVVRLGPVGVVLVGLLMTVFAALVLVLLVGTVLIWIPLAALFVVAAALVRLLRAYLRS